MAFAGAVRVFQGALWNFNHYRSHLLSTFGDVITDVLLSDRDNTGEKNAYLLAEAQRVWPALTRSDNWPQTRVPGLVVTIASGAQNYDLPADFDRIAGERVNYNPLSSSNFNAYSLPIVHRGSERDDTRISIWESVLPPSVYPYPSAVCVTGGAVNTYALQLLPLAGNTGDTITLDYYAVLQRTEITTGTALPVEQLYQTLFDLLSAAYYRYLQRADMMQANLASAALSHKVARMSLSRL